MLKGISPVFNPELLATLYRMGHGDEIVVADAHFPGESLHKHVIRADGVETNDLLEGILPLFEVDSYVADPLVMMAVVEGDTADPGVESGYKNIIQKHAPGAPGIVFIERFQFYKRARNAFCIVISGDTRKYANIILKKGVTPI